MTKSTSDIFMSIKPENIQNIVSSAKNHIYRSYLLPPRIQHIWFYTTSPVKQIAYVARISGAKVPGEVLDDGGIGNADFNAELKVMDYGYEILVLWKLNTPVSLETAIREGYLKSAPQKYCWVPLDFLGRFPLDEQDQVFSRI
ncbi:hypothetical protein N7475_009921 [Penicillium sp. IBT 31633x]|nr:hypothetical protein N7475_009921 [Penicillium sp. IBT 31633x]